MKKQFSEEEVDRTKIIVPVVKEIVCDFFDNAIKKIEAATKEDRARSALLLTAYSTIANRIVGGLMKSKDQTMEEAIDDFLVLMRNCLMNSRGLMELQQEKVH